MQDLVKIHKQHIAFRVGDNTHFNRDGGDAGIGFRKNSAWHNIGNNGPFAPEILLYDERGP